jgi:hypothetical protein
VRSYFTFPELVKVISVHRAHRLLSESTLILCTLRQRPMKHVPEHEQLRGRDDGHLAALTPSTRVFLPLRVRGRRYL